MLMIMRISRNLEHNQVGFEVKHSEMELHLTKLNTAENVLLCVIRNWVASVNENEDPRPFLGRAFDAAGILDGAPMFDELMLLTASTAFRGMDIRCEKCKVVGAGEKDILSVVSFFQSARVHWGYNRLLSWLPATSARRAFPLARNLSNTMSNVGLYVELRNEYLEFEVIRGQLEARPSVGLPISKTFQ